MLIVALIRHFELTERHIADCGIKEAVGEIGILKALHGNAVFLIQLLCNPSRNAVKLNTVKFCITHTVGYKPHKVTDAAGGFKNIAAFEVHISKRFVYRLNNNGRRVKGCQCRLSCRRIIVLRKYAFQFFIMGIVFFKKLRQTAPTDIIGKDTLLVCIGKPVFALQLFEKSYRVKIVIEPVEWCANADVIVINAEIRAVIALYFGIENTRRNLTLLFLFGRRSKGYFRLFFCRRYNSSYFKLFSRFVSYDNHIVSCVQNLLCVFFGFE